MCVCECERAEGDVFFGQCLCICVYGEFDSLNDVFMFSGSSGPGPQISVMHENLCVLVRK